MPDPVTGAIIGTAVVSGGVSMWASNQAADAQRDAANAGIGEQRRQFNAMQRLLEPYVQAGNQGLDAYGDLLGTNGAGQQQRQINMIAGSPEMAALTQQGENSLLQNASATGGLRGGNIQSALAQFRPALLANLINQRYTQFGNLAQLGQSSAAGVGNAGMQTGQNVAALMGQAGSAQAGGYLATANAINQPLGVAQSLGGMYLGQQYGRGYGAGSGDAFASVPPPSFGDQTSINNYFSQGGF